MNILLWTRNLSQYSLKKPREEKSPRKSFKLPGNRKSLNLLAIVVSDTKKEGFSVETPPEETMIETAQTWGKMRKARLREVNERPSKPIQEADKEKAASKRQTATKRRVSWILFYFCDKTP